MMIYNQVRRTHGVYNRVYLQIIVSICPSEKLLKRFLLLRVYPQSSVVRRLTPGMAVAPPPHFPNDRYLPYLLALQRRSRNGLASVWLREYNAC